MLDAIATRYHVLPSTVMSTADTLDYYVMDVANSYHQYQQGQAERKRSGQPPPAPALSINKMQEMIERVRR